MRRTSHFHKLVLIRLLTFVSVIGTQFHVLSVFATVTHIDDSNTTTVSSGPKTPTVSFSSPTSPSTLPTFEPSSSEINPSGTSKVMNSNSNNNIHFSTSMTSQGSSTAATLSGTKNTSRFPIDYSSVKNQWAFTDGALNHGALFPSGSTAADVERPRTFRNKHHHEHHWGPFFEEPLNSSTSGENLVSKAHLFTEAVLNCRVGMLKDKTVMWVRRTTEKVSLLTVGNVTYSGDPRIRVKYQYPNNWRLLINPTQKEDAGVYMCQVSTHPPRVFTTNLTILEPPLRLIDDQEHEVSDRYYKSGSAIDLQCQVSISFVLKEKLSIMKSLQPQFNQNKNVSNTKTTSASKALGTRINELISNASQPAKMGQFEKQYNNFILWSKDGGELPSTAFKRSSSNDKWLTSRISIPDAKISDSGNYSCSVGKLFRAIVFVQVLTGELPAAVQHNSAQSYHPVLPPFWIHLPCICFLVAFKVLSRYISPFMRKGPSTLKILL